MFAVIFEVQPKAEQWEPYLGYARLLRPELEQIDGFVDNIRYRSLTREGWLLSLSSWGDEKALVRWRTRARHHEVQEHGRFEVFRDYHLRVGEITRDTGLPAGQVLREQRLDETIAGAATTLTLVDARHPPDWARDRAPAAVAQALGLTPGVADLVAWDVFDAVLSPGDTVLLMSWRDRAAAESFARTAAPPEGARLRQIRVVRDYGMFDRREAPQFYPDVKGAPTRHA
jgi:heme-degrading monooxygenase HmoA